MTCLITMYPIIALSVLVLVLVLKREGVIQMNREVLVPNLVERGERVDLGAIHGLPCRWRAGSAVGAVGALVFE
jgi:hypothetical protein